jgi:hypothetical protein
MATSSYFMDVNPQYRDAGCPSQCMSMNEYTTVGEYYSYGTDPKTALLRAMETPAPIAPAVAPAVDAAIPAFFSEDYRTGVRAPARYEMQREPIMLGSISTRFEECLMRDSYGNCLKSRQ